MFYIHNYIQFFQIYYDPSKNYEVSSDDFDDSLRNVDSPNNETSFIITDLIPETNYTVYLSAFTGAGEGNLSVSRTITTLSDRKYFS